MKTKIKGLKNLQKRFDKMTKDYSGEYEISELLTPEFLKEYTNYSSIDEFFKSLNVTTVEDFQALSDETLDNVVSNNSKFNSYQEMLNDSALVLIKNKWNN